MIVVDANVVVYAVFRTPEFPLVEKLLAADDDWRLPKLWLHEFASAATTFVRVGQADLRQASAAIDAAVSLVAGRDEDVDLHASIETAIRLDLSAYDAQYVVLAQTHGVRLVTADQKLIRNAPGAAVALRDYVTASP